MNYFLASLILCMVVGLPLVAFAQGRRDRRRHYRHLRRQAAADLRRIRASR